MNNSLYIITNPMPLNNKSAEVTLSKFVRVLQGAEKRIEIIGGNVTLEEDISNVSITTFDVPKYKNKAKQLLNVIFFQMKAAWKVLKSVKRGDNVFFWLGDKMIIPFFAAKVKKATINYYIYGNLEATLGKGLSSKLIVFKANHASCVFVESKCVLEDWGKEITNPNSQVMHLYADTVRFSDLSKREKKVGMVCRLAKEKHVLEAIMAFKKFHVEYPDWTFEIVGTGIDYEKCKKLIQDYNASGYINLLGWVDHSKLSDIIEHWNFVLSASDHEGVPNGLIETMGLGIPAIAHPVGGIPDVIVDNMNGLLLSGVTTDDIYGGLVKAVNVSNYDIMAEKAFETTSSEYSFYAAREQSKNIVRHLV